jgi:hypothetical protein
MAQRSLLKRNLALVQSYDLRMESAQRCHRRKMEFRSNGAKEEFFE